MTKRKAVSMYRTPEAEERILEREVKRQKQFGRLRRSNQSMATRTGATRNISRTGGVMVAPMAGGIISIPRVPRFKTTGDSTVVRGTEILNNQVLAAAGAFSTNSTALIPSSPSWLAGVGDLYSKYRWLELDIVWSPKCPTTTSGSVVMALTYDRNDAAPASRAQLAQSYKAINFPPYAGYDGAAFLNSRNGVETAIRVTLDVMKLDKPWYPTISSASFAALGVLDQNQFCPATIVVASDGGPVAATPAGDLFIKYVIEFIEPINPTMNV